LSIVYDAKPPGPHAASLIATAKSDNEVVSLGPVALNGSAVGLKWTFEIRSEVEQPVVKSDGAFLDIRFGPFGPGSSTLRKRRVYLINTLDRPVTLWSNWRIPGVTIFKAEDRCRNHTLKPGDRCEIEIEFRPWRGESKAGYMDTLFFCEKDRDIPGEAAPRGGERTRFLTMRPNAMASTA
jgi:hypothetical protein